MHERCWNIVLKLDDGQSQSGDGQNLRAVNRPVPFKLSRCRHAKLVGEMSPLVVVLKKQNKRRRNADFSQKSDLTI